MTREEHRAAYEEHSAKASELLDAAVESAALDPMGFSRRRKLIGDYHDELTAASAHLALSMLLAEVDAV